MNHAHRCGYVALIGIPNVGKSSLLNSLVEEEVAIVSALPQTTRQRICGIYSTDDVQLIFLDTPGLHESEKIINQAMVEWSHSAMTDADLCCPIITREAWDAMLPIVDAIPKRTLGCVILNKVDLLTEDGIAKLARQLQNRWEVPVFATSALNGAGVTELRDFLISRMPEGPALFPKDQYTEHPVRFLAAELIRKAAIEHLFEEIPYAVAVEIDTFEESPTLTRITAILVVERESQKGMVIGKGARTIKAIGTAARQTIERLVGTKIFLDLRVRVQPKWTRDPQQLQRFGIKRMK